MGNHTSAEFRLRVEGELDPPVLSCDVPAAGWSPADVEVPSTASDATGLASPADGASVLRTSVPPGVEDASARTDTRRVCDVFGNCAVAGPYAFPVDRRAPTDVAASADRAPDAGTCYRDPVAVAFTGRDAGSGVAEGWSAMPGS